MNDAKDATMVYPLFDHLAGSLGARNNEPLHTHDGVPAVAQSTGHWQFALEMEHELQPQAGTPSTAQLHLPTSSLREEDMVQCQLYVPLWSNECPIQVVGDNCERASDPAVTMEPTSTLADTSPFPTDDPLLGAGLASAPSQGSPVGADTPHLSSPHLSSPHLSSFCVEVSGTDINSRFGGVLDDVGRYSPSRQGMSNPIRGDEELPEDDFPFGRSNTDCQGEDHSKPARPAKPSSTLAGSQEMAAPRRHHRPTHTKTPPRAGRSSFLDSEPSEKPGARREVAPHYSMQDNSRRTSLDRLHQRGRKRTRSVEGHLQARQLSGIDRDSSIERAAKRRRSAVKRQTTTVRTSSRLDHDPQQRPREISAASGPQTTLLGVKVRSGIPTGPKSVEPAASSSPTKERAGQASRCHACGLSPLLLGVAKKALAFDGLDGLLENLQTELLPSQSALIAGVIRFCSSLIENHVSEGRRSVGPSRVSSSRSEPESDSQFDMILDDESVEDQETMSEGGFSSDKTGSYDETGSDDNQRGQRRRWSRLDEARLTAYMRENLSMPLIATKLNRSTSAITQHWRIMSDPSRSEAQPCYESAVDDASSTNHRQSLAGRNSPTAGQIQDSPYFQVENILGWRWRKGREGAEDEREYLVKWEGYGHDDNTWEPATHFEGCPEFLEQFHQKAGLSMAPS